MGNCCASRIAKSGQNFDKKEKKCIKELFKKLIDMDDSTKGKNYIKAKALCELFAENSNFADALFIFMNKLNGVEFVTFEIFLNMIDLLTKENKDQKTYNEFRGFDKMEIFALIIFELNEMNGREDLKKIQISYTDAMKYVKNILCIFTYDLINQKIDENIIRALLNGIFKNDIGVISCWDLLFSIKKQLIFLNKILEFYFSFKFLSKTVHFQLPSLSESSYIIDNETLAMLYMSNSYLHNVSKLKLLYSNILYGYNYKKLVESITDLECPMLFLIKNEDKSQKNFAVFGAFSSESWKNTASYHGSEDNYIFSIYPTFKNYFIENSELSENNYQYLWATDNIHNVSPLGIGFGGSNKKNFRLWIDGNDLNKSSCFSQDNTFQQGFLCPPHLEKLNISTIEIWGLGTDLSYNSSMLNKSKNQRYLYVREFDKYYKKTEAGLLMSSKKSESTI